jgi:hypothetical protein
LQFFGLSEDVWKAGFSTQTEVFDWIASSRFFDARKMQRSSANNTAKTRVRDGRTMYQTFVHTYVPSRVATSPASHDPDSRFVADAAIDFFGKRALYDVLLHIAAAKQRVGERFSGTRVQEWTGVQGMPVRFIMDEVRLRLGSEDILQVVSGVRLDSLQSEGVDRVHLTLRAWEAAMAEMEAEEVKTLVVRAKEELDAEGALWYDWKTAKKKKDEMKKRKLLEQDEQGDSAIKV